MTDTPGAVIRHHLMPFGCRLVIPPSFQTQIWIAFFCHSSSIDEADMPPNDDDFHFEAIPPATHGRGPFRRSSSFHETKLHPNDGHFHLVVNPSAIKGKGLHVHLVHKSMILQSGPFLVLEPQKYTCLPASFGHEKSQFLRRLKLTNQNINKFAGSFCQHNCYILGLFRLTKPKNPKILKFWPISGLSSKNCTPFSEHIRQKNPKGTQDSVQKRTKQAIFG